MKFLALIYLLVFTAVNSISQDGNDLEIFITNVRSGKGHVSIALFKGETGFPENSEKAYLLQISEITNGKAKFEFKDLPPGEYAFAILHDENKDGIMQKNLFGIPKEGFGFSLNFKPSFGKPTFEDTSFRMPSKESKIEIRMIYYL